MGMGKLRKEISAPLGSRARRELSLKRAYSALQCYQAQRTPEDFAAVTWNLINLKSASGIFRTRLSINNEGGWTLPTRLYLIR